LMALIKGDCISCENSSHNTSDSLDSASNQQMDVVSHKGPCVDNRFIINDSFTQSSQEISAVSIINEDILFVDSSHHNMVKGAGGVKTGMTGHTKRIEYFKASVKSYAWYATTSPISYRNSL
jgi:hypothetical protein